MKEILMMNQVQLGIFALVVLALVLNFIIKLCLIKAGIYKRIYKQKRLDGSKIKGGVFLMGLSGLFIAAIKYDLGFLMTVLLLIILIGVTQVISGLFLSSKSWKSYKYWD